MSSRGGAGEGDGDGAGNTRVDVMVGGTAASVVEEPNKLLRKLITSHPFQRPSHQA